MHEPVPTASTNEPTNEPTNPTMPAITLPALLPISLFTLIAWRLVNPVPTGPASTVEHAYAHARHANPSTRQQRPGFQGAPAVAARLRGGTAADVTDSAVARAIAAAKTGAKSAATPATTGRGVVGGGSVNGRARRRGAAPLGRRRWRM